MVLFANSHILGKNLKFLRQSKGLTVEEMADLIHTDPIEIELLEAGEIFEIEDDSLHLLCESYEGDSSHLFDELLDKN